MRKQRVAPNFRVNLLLLVALSILLPPQSNILFSKPNGTALHMPVKHCQHCFKAETEVSLKACRNCLRAVYCSRECQRAEWKQHKQECQVSKNTPRSVSDKTEFIEQEVVELMEKWAQFYRLPLIEAAKHALKIQWQTNVVLTDCLNVVLTPRFTLQNLPKTPKEVRAAFSCRTAFVSTIESMTKALPERFESDVFATIRSSLDMRGQKDKAIGYAIVMLMVPACGFIHQVPLGPFEEERVISLDPEWLGRLAGSIAQHIPGKSYHFEPDE